MWYTQNKINYYGGSKPGVYTRNTLTETKNATYGLDVQKDISLSEKSLLTVGANAKKKSTNLKLSKEILLNLQIKKKEINLRFLRSWIKNLQIKII